MTPRRYQSGETDRAGPISRASDPAVRLALFEASRHDASGEEVSTKILSRWRGAKRGKVALARKLAMVLHRMWVSETDFRYAAAKEA